MKLNFFLIQDSSGSSVPGSLINIKGITVQKVSDSGQAVAPAPSQQRGGAGGPPARGGGVPQQGGPGRGGIQQQQQNSQQNAALMRQQEQAINR
jgi:hypothetical protein